MDSKLRKYLRRRSRGFKLMMMTSVFVMGYLYHVGTTAYGHLTFSYLNGAAVDQNSKVHDNIHQLRKSSLYIKTKNIWQIIELEKINFQPGRKLLEDSNDSDSSYPKDAFSLQEKRNGAVILHIFGMIYMFIALAVVCDEFFVPSLGVITEKLDISEDVSGATFMAAGGSAPELFTSVIGVFIANNDVGIGTIVGSAVFNILFVIGMCALFSKEVLALTWWPLFRDVSFYSVSLLFLIGFFSDDKIEWWEALVLFLSYISYVTFMKYNRKVEVVFKTWLSRYCKCFGNKVTSSSQPLSGTANKKERFHGVPYLHSGSGHYRHGVAQLMIHTIDPVTEAKVHDKAMQLQAKLQDTVNPVNKPNNTSTSAGGDNDMQIKVVSNGKVQVEQNNHIQSESDLKVKRDKENTKKGDAESRSIVNDGIVMVSINSPHDTTNVDAPKQEAGPFSEETEEPLDISWPDTTRKQLTYIFLAPIILPLYVTLPDVRRQGCRMFFPWTFIGSVLWIAGYSYCMAWWASQTGETIGIPDAVMGLTVLAAGTSIPDLITSVIVAKKGFGDMAVSSSVGSNIFDITVGLPVPWLLYSAVNSGDPYTVVSKGLLCSIFLLFFMLIAVIISIAVSGWKLSKALGISMLVLYLIFITLAVLLEYEIILCPAT